jgi:hypothetical protein
MVKDNMNSRRKEAVPRCGCHKKGWKVNGAYFLFLRFLRAAAPSA